MSRPTPPRQNIAEKIARTLRASIVKGRLQPGAALPSERVLAEKYDVNRSSVREAMKRLEAWGLVTIRQGGATRVADQILDAGMSLLPELLEAGGELGLGVLHDLHELRGLLLGWSAEQAALKADASSVARLDVLARSLSEPRQKTAALQALDYDFFEQLVQISGNQLLALFTKVVRDIYFRAPERYLPLYRPDVFDPGHHRRAVAAIRAKDGRAAGDAMRAHAASALSLLRKGQA
jgi:GntR family transcriptional regulator, transcriptional repressor for pyruvate dehydrogenase complex